MNILEQTISLNGLRFYAYHGIKAQEAVAGGWYRVNLTIKADASNTIASDNIEDTLDYGKAAAIVKEQMEIPSKLIEHLAGKIAKKLIECYGNKLKSVTVTVIKENPPLGIVCDESTFTLSLER